MKHRRFFFAIIVVIYCALSASYALITPPWESPDETAHFLYASQLAERWRPPLKSDIQQTLSFSRDQAYISSNYEWFQPAMGYLPAAAAYKVLMIIAPDNLPTQTPLLSALVPTIPSKYNIFIHPDLGVFQGWDGNWGLLIMRWFCLLFGLPVIFSVYKLGNLLDQKGGYLGIAAAGWVAFLPQFTFINASVRSDTLTNAIASLVFLDAAWMLTSREHENQKALLMGVLLGFGFLCKHTFIYMIPIGLLAIILSNPHSPQTWSILALFILVPALLICGIYYLAYDEARIAITYTFSSALRINPNLLTWQHLYEIPEPLFIDLFYARFGWANVEPPAILPKLAFGFWCVGIFFTLVQVAHVYRKPELSLQIKILLLLSAGLLLAILGVVRYNLSNVQPQGRFLFPALIPWAILGFWGLWQKLPDHKKKIAAILITSFMLLFNLYAIFFTLIPAYWN